MKDRWLKQKSLYKGMVMLKRVVCLGHRKNTLYVSMKYIPGERNDVGKVYLHNKGIHFNTFKNEELRTH